MEQEFKVTLNNIEILKALKEISKKILRILYVYEKSEENPEYNYKPYVYAVILYISSFNELVEYELTDILVNLNSLLINDFDKRQIKKIVFECKNIVDKVLEK